MTDHRGRQKLLDVREERRGASRLEFREDNKTGAVILEGYASTFEPYDVHGGPSAGGWVEKLDYNAFDKTLASKPDVQLLINHEGTPLARTTSGTLKLSRDQHGLRVWATLDPTDPDVQRLIPKMRRGDMDEMSFAFRVKDQAWDSNYVNRTINELSLQKGDVSVVNYGMNPGTRAILSAEAVDTLAQLSNSDLVELRSRLDTKQIQRAQQALTAVRAAKGDDSGKQPYGNVKYADPGYQKDGKKRYPIDTKDHAKAAWSYISMPKNQKGYSAEQVNSIKGRIKSALKEFGVDASDDERSAAMTPGGTVATWNPGGTPQDPHDESYQTGDGKPSFGPTPPNIIGGGSPGSGVSEFSPDLTCEDPHDQDFSAEGSTGSFTPDSPGWTSPTPEGDPHQTPYTTVDGVGSGGGGGTAAPNIIGAGTAPGSYNPSFSSPGAPGDPHETPYSESERGMEGYDPHETPYMSGTGSLVSGVAGSNIVTGPVGANDNWSWNPDTSNTDPHDGGVGGGPQYSSPTSGWVPTAPAGDPHQTPYRTDGGYDHGPQAPNIIGGGKVGNDNPGFGGVGPSPDPHGTSFDGQRGITLDGPKAAATGSAHGQTVANHGEPEYDPETGEFVHKVPQPERQSIDLGMFAALDKTISHAYGLSEGNDQVRKLLSVAGRQLHDMCGVKRSRSDDISRHMQELRQEVGMPDTGTVQDCFKYLRSAGSAPVGFRGGFYHDPELHVVTPAERLAMEKQAELTARAKTKARKAAEEAAVAEERFKKATREAQINDMIKRRKQATS
jgi:HK97 family phage prohead protease